MKRMYKLFLVFLGMLLSWNALFSQGFEAKDPMFVSRIKSSRDYEKITKFADLFNFPEDLSLKDELTENSDVTIVFTSTSEAQLSFSKYYYSSYSGQYFYYHIPAGAYGHDTLSINITYKGVSTSALLIVQTEPIKCNDDSYDLSIGEAQSLDVLKNDQAKDFFDLTSLELIDMPSAGTVTILDEGVFQYENNPSTPNYTIDSFRYRLADTDANYDTATVTVSIHKNSYVTKVFDYLPGPGQYVNTSWADTAAAKAIIGNTGSGVSLGGFGGYIVAGFDQPIVNRDKNAYGVDFTINGNAFGGWGEPAAVQVMKDENKNGLPDDTWYELAGSDYYFKSSIKNLRATYYNPKTNSQHSVAYKTDAGQNGVIRTNNFHKQSYFPDPFVFGVDMDSLSYTGTLTHFLLDKSKANNIAARRIPVFGYADTHSKNTTPTVPQNPYFSDDNGKVADGFDLEWAVDEHGNHVDIDTADFVKIYTTVQEDGGWLGEVSPEIFSIGLTTPDADYVDKDFEFHAISAPQLQVLKGTELTFEGILFKNGIPQAGVPTWTSDSMHVASIDNNGVFRALDNGSTTIRFSAKPDVAIDSLLIEVVELKQVVLEPDGNTNQEKDTLRMIKGATEYIHAEAIDNRSGDRNRFVYESFDWSNSNPTVGRINQGLFTAKSIGSTTLIVQSQSNPDLKDTLVVVVDEVPEISAKVDTLKLAYYNRQGTLNNNDLFIAGENALVLFESLSFNAEGLEAQIVDNRCEYIIKDGVYGCMDVEFVVAAYGQSKAFTIVFEAVEPENLETPKQVLFTNGGEFMNLDAPTELMTYIPAEDTTIQLDNYLAGASSVQDMLVDGNFAYVSADYYITRYNISKRIATDSVYTQDLSATEADGQGTEMAGLNHKLAVYENLLLATRQNSGAEPEDGYNVRVYNKTDLSFVKKIPVSNQATDLVIVNDTAYVMINGGFAGMESSLAIIDLRTLTLNREIDLGTNGLGVSQMMAVDGKIYCARLADFMGRYNAGIVIYDIASNTQETVEYNSGIPFDSSPLLIEPYHDHILFIKKDLGYVPFNMETKTFGDKTFMNIPLRYTQDVNFNGKGSVYDPEDDTYYVAYSYWTGDGVGQIFDGNGDSIGSFEGVGASAEVLKLCEASGFNESPYVATKNSPKTFKEGEDFSFSLSYNTFKDQEDGRPSMYLYNPAQYAFLDFNAASRRISGRFDDEVLDTTKYNVLIQGIDEQGAFVIDTATIILIPVDDSLDFGIPIADFTVLEDAADTFIDLRHTFVDPDNVISTSIQSNSDESMVEATIHDNVLQLSFQNNQSGSVELIVDAESNGKVLVDTFTVTILPVEDALQVLNPIEDITVLQNASELVIGLESVFVDVDDEAAVIEKTISRNSNTELVHVAIVEDELRLSFMENEIGEAEIVIVGISNEKVARDTFVVNVTLATDMQGRTSHDVMLYPNPTKGKFIISGTTREPHNVAIYDLRGTLVYRNDAYISSNEIDLSHQASGLYLVKFDSGERIITKTIVIN